MNAYHFSLSEMIATEQSLEEVLGKPGPRVLAKVVDRLDAITVRYSRLP